MKIFLEILLCWLIPNAFSTHYFLGPGDGFNGASEMLSVSDAGDVSVSSLPGVYPGHDTVYGYGGGHHHGLVIVCGGAGHLSDQVSDQCYSYNMAKQSWSTFPSLKK